MGIINLSNPSNIGMNLAQADVRSSVNDAIYDGLGRISSSLKETADEFKRRNREMDLTEKMTNSLGELEQEEAKFNNEWIATVGEGKWFDKSGRSFETAKKEFFTQKKIEISSSLNDIDPYASEMFDLKANQYISKSLVNDINFKWKFGAKVAESNVKNAYDNIKNQITHMHIEALPTLWGQYKESLNDSVKQLSGFSVQGSAEAKKKYDADLSEHTFDKVYSNDLKLGTNPVEAYKDILPIPIHFNPMTKKVYVDLLKEAELSGSSTDVDLVRRAFFENQKTALSVLKQQLVKKVSLEKDHEWNFKYQSTLEKVNKLLESPELKIDYKTAYDKETDRVLFNMDDINLFGEDKEAQDSIQRAFSDKATYEIWDNLTPEKKVENLKRILSIKADENKHGLEILNTRMKNIINIPLDLGDAKKTFIGLDRSNGALKEAIKQFDDPSIGRFEFHSASWWTEQFYAANANKIVNDMVMNPYKYGNKGFDFAKFHKANIESIMQSVEGNKEILNELNLGLTGTAFRAEQKKIAEKSYRAIKYAVSKNPEMAMIFYGSDKLNNYANRAFTPNGINEKALQQLNSVFNNEFAGTLTPWNIDASNRLMGEVASKYYKSVSRLLESNDPNNQALALDPLTKLSPEFGGKLITIMQTNGQIDESAANSLRVAMTFNKTKNQALYNSIISSSQGAKDQEIKSYYSSSAEKKDELTLIRQTVSDKINEFYQFSTDAQSKEAMSKNISNYIAYEKMRDPSQNESNLIDRTIKELLNKEKINLNSSSIAGTLAKAHTEESEDEIDTQMSKKLASYKSKIIKGELNIDFSKVPGYSESLGKYKTDTNMRKKIMADFFVNDNYDIRFETMNDTGNSRDVYLVGRDKSTNQKFMLRTIDNQIIKERVD